MDDLGRKKPINLAREAVLDALPSPAFIVDEDVRILDFNSAAKALLGAAPRSSLHRRGGDVLHCIYAGASGCGKSPSCRSCVIRKSVKGAVKGRPVSRKFHQAELRTSRGAVPVHLRVSANLLPNTAPPQVLLVLETVAITDRPGRRRLVR